MPLGLLARDSITDLQNFSKDAFAASGPTVSTKDTVKHESDSSTQEQDSAPESPTPGAQHTDVSDTSSPRTNGRGSDDVNDDNSAKSPSSSYGQYTGFRNDYNFHDLHSDSYYYHDTYAPVYSKPKQTVGFWEGLLPCLFPWTSSQGRLQDIEEDGENGDSSNSIKGAASKDEDEVSNSSAIMGEKLSEKERMAVLNRLRLGQPDAVKSDQSSSDGSVEKKEKKKGLFNKGLPSLESNGGKIKGILKNTAPRPPLQPKKEKSTADQSGAARRSLFPQYSGVGSSFCETNSKGHVVSFAPMARVVTVKSRNDMTQDEKGDIWWQKVDYDDFRKTGRIITRAMLEGGSEIWLSHQSSRPKTQEEEADDPADMISATGDKWWHKFGHSRRGLEHVVSIDEGRSRQLNVRRAIQSILEEQARQRLVRKQDPERLRHVSMQYTSWARDLALASGASDADAVQTKFSDGRKSREFYLLKIARNSPLQGADRHVPDFMQPAIQAVMSPRLAKKSVPAPHVLDANTSAQIRYRREALQKDGSKREDLQKDEPQGEEVDEPVHDAENEESRESIARRAAGFSADGDGKVDMAAVLSGMGALPQNSQVMSTA
mmetsp:Transcript_9837/g.18848  ORF Transcript_9837/g.18848 Transcript_9837/m.18848 type:complete len:602 (+) Transcript_9837:283-2088(+)|eukprot:scaffold5795_cov165-Amphora_coffeaeformis.AAC.8